MDGCDKRGRGPVHGNLLGVSSTPCAPPASTPTTLDRAFGARLTGIDATEEFCAAAVDLKARTGLSSRVRIEQADALALPFPDASFAE